MRKLLLPYILLCFLSWKSHAQENLYVGIGAGWGYHQVHDQKINPYTYQGASAKRIMLEAGLKDSSFLLQFKARGYANEALPNDYNSLLYHFNQQKNRLWSADLSYLRTFSLSSVRLSVGPLLRMDYAHHQQHYKNRLYEAAEGYRQSYYWAFSLGIQLQAQLAIKAKNQLQLSGQNAAIAYIGRPNDNYVKQIGLHQSTEWGMGWGKEWQHFQWTLSYKRNFANHWSGFIEYQQWVQKFIYTDEYLMSLSCFTLGIQKGF